MSERPSKNVFTAAHDSIRPLSAYYQEQKRHPTQKRHSTSMRHSRDKLHHNQKGYSALHAHNGQCTNKQNTRFEFSAHTPQT